MYLKMHLNYTLECAAWKRHIIGISFILLCDKSFCMKPLYKCVKLIEL